MNKKVKTDNRRSGNWLKKQFAQRPKPLWMVITADVLLIGISLVVFALFHHVLPRYERSAGLTSSREVAAGAQSAIAVNDYDALEADDGSADVTMDLSAMSDDSVSFSEDGAEDAPAEAAAVDAEPAEAPAEETPEDVAADDAAHDAADQTDASAAEDDRSDDGDVMLAGDLSADVPGYFGDKFADKFTNGEIIKSKSGYQSENVNITLKRYAAKKMVFYVADIYVRDITNLVTAFARDTFGRGIRDYAGNISKQIGAILAINGDYYGGRSDGIVIRNGELYRSDSYPDRDVCVLFWDGSMETYGTKKFDAEAAIAAGAYQAWNFGPRLLDSEGKAKKKFNSDVGPTNPRTALGYYEPGHYCFVAVDGRQSDSAGMTLKELSALMQELGCVRAYNMDGGNTSVMVAGGKIVNRPSGGGRPTTDIIAIVDN